MISDDSSNDEIFKAEPSESLEYKETLTEQKSVNYS
jgi:hypothetical protein